jgi:hypothetical protein
MGMLLIFVESIFISESSVYFTNEVTDGRPCEALISIDKAGILEFDSDILPEFLSHI